MVKLTLIQTAANTWEIRRYKESESYISLASTRALSQYEAENWARVFISSWNNWSIDKVIPYQKEINIKISKEPIHVVYENMKLTKHLEWVSLIPATEIIKK